MDRVWRGLMAGSIHNTIYMPVFKALKIPLPPVKEQRAIATALGDMDALLDGLDRLIAKKRAIKQATMQQLLTGQTRLPGFSGEWEVKRLGELAQIQRGASPRPIDSPRWFDENSNVGWVRISDVTSSGMYLEQTTQRLSPDGVAHSRPVDGGNLIMSICATVGRPIITNIDVCIHDGFVVFDNIKADRSFIYYVLKWIEPDWSKHGQTGSQMNLNTGLINSTTINLPPTDEQTAIATVLSDIDAEITALETRRTKTRALKQAMMQELLTGRTRLIEPAENPIQEEVTHTEGRKANVHFLRSVLAAEIIDQLHDQPTFGHVKFEKMMFLAEHLCQVDIGSTYHRKAAGPYDNRALRSIDSQLQKQQWFDARKQEGRYQYVPLAKRGGHKPYFERYFSGIAENLEKILGTFKTAKTEQCEIVATLLAAWSDLLREKGTVSDEMIVHEVLHNWHEAKQRIPEDRWLAALDWMRKKGFVPKGATLP